MEILLFYSGFEDGHWMRVSPKQAHSSRLEEAASAKERCAESSEKSFAEISDAMHRHTD
jgi:hypothetical protein